jgi:hypothetical protein
VLIRLHPNIPESWEWWPKFERRLRLKAETLTPHTPVEQLIVLLRAWWGTEPWRFLALVQLDDEMDDLDAHLLAWLEEPWGRVVMLVQQIQADNELSNDARRFGFAQLGQWMGELASLGIDVTAIRFASKRHNGWVSWLNHYAGVPTDAIEDEGHILRVDPIHFFGRGLADLPSAKEQIEEHTAWLKRREVDY